MNKSWEQSWGELRRAVESFPLCPDHPEYPCVATMIKGAMNDIIEVKETEIVVRSHETNHDDRISKSVFHKWFEHLWKHKSASSAEGTPSCPERYRSRVVAAIYLNAFPDVIRQSTDKPNMIELLI